MNKEWILIPVMCFALAVSGWAEAQSTSRIRTSGKSPRIDFGQRASSTANRGYVARGSAGVRGNAGVRGSSGVRRPSIPAGANLNHGRNPGLGQNPFGNGNSSGNGLGGLLGQYLNNGYGYNRHFDPYEGEKAQAKAYRDAAIANAIVNVVGILATANQPRLQAVCPTQGVAAAPAAPCGYVERQRILVQEGRTEEYQVWIPEYTIPETGELVVGHHETRRREIAPVYQEREVWVPSR